MRKTRGGHRPLSQVVRVLISLLISSHYVYYLRAWHRLPSPLPKYWSTTFQDLTAGLRARILLLSFSCLGIEGLRSLRGSKKRRGEGGREKRQSLSLFPFLPIPSRRLLRRLGLRECNLHAGALSNKRSGNVVKFSAQFILNKTVTLLVRFFGQMKRLIDHVPDGLRRPVNTKLRNTSLSA